MLYDLSCLDCEDKVLYRIIWKNGLKYVQYGKEEVDVPRSNHLGFMLEKLRMHYGFTFALTMT